jgi:hypothetical protein
MCYQGVRYQGLRYQGWVMAACVVLAGCSALPVADTTPLAPTAVIKASSSFGGLVLPSVKGDETLYFRADRKRSSNDFQFENWMLKHTAGHFMSGSEDIIRLDKGVQWVLNKKDKAYTECPVAGCPYVGSGSKPTRPGTEPPAHEDACKRTLKRSEFKTIPTSEHRSVAGVDTRKYTFSWIVELKDAQGRLASNTVTFDFWTAEPSGVLKQALAVQDTFNKNYLAALTAGSPGTMALNRDVYAALAKLGSSAGLRGEKLALTLAREMQKIKGYPLAMAVEWRAVDNTCGAQASAAAPAPKAEPTSLSPMDWLGQKAAQSMMGTVDPNEALLHYNHEITSVSLGPEHDSIFDVPMGYTLRTSSGQ